MRALEKSVEWLRPLVETKAWSYCVVWKFGDDPSRFIEWVGCCCGGGKGDCINVKEESDAEQHLLPLCRDAYIQHCVKTKACEILSQFPSSMPLYSGIHGEVAISSQPKWISHANTSSSNHSHESIGTQVLIPVGGGLIELFTSKHVPKNQNLIEFIMAQHNIFVEHEAMTAQSHTNLTFIEKTRDPYLGEYLNYRPTSLPYLNFVPRLQNLSPISQPSTYPSFEGSSTCSTPSNEHYPSFKSGCGHVSPNQSIGKPNCNEILSTKEDIEFALRHAKRVVDQKDNLKARPRTEREQYQSKNLITERNRRNRIKDGLFALRTLVPKISKMDRASIIGDAIEYTEELQKTVKKLQDELREMSAEDCNNNNAELEVAEVKRTYKRTRDSPATEHNQSSSNADVKQQMEVQVEVSQIGIRDFLLRIICSHKRCGFLRLMEAINSLGLEVMDANVTTLNGRVLNILKVEEGGGTKEFERFIDQAYKLDISDRRWNTPCREEAERILEFKK